MIKRTFLQVICLICFLATPTLSLGTGLGGVLVKSGLGEPLYAEIDLLGITQDEVNGLQVKLATSDEYMTSGLSDIQIIREIRFDILQRENAFKLILRTRKPVNEPFLDVLLHLDSQTTHLYRQYTLLLDPPSGDKTDVLDTPQRIVLDETADVLPSLETKHKARRAATSAAIDAAQDPEATPKLKSKRQKKPKQELAEEPVTQPQAMQGMGDTYLTKEGDIFGKVAQRYQPEGVRLKDVMAAFYQANPDAFLDGDINSLKAGQVLKVPDLQALPQKKAKKSKIEEKPVQSPALDAGPVKLDKPKFVLHLSAGDASAPDFPVDPSKPVQAAAAPSNPPVVTAPAPLIPPLATPSTPEAPVAVAVAEAPALQAPPAPVVEPEVVKTPSPSVLSNNSAEQKDTFSYGIIMDRLVWLSIGLGIALAAGVGFFLLVFAKSKFQKKALDDLVDGDLITKMNLSTDFDHSKAHLSNLKADDFSDDFLANSAFPNNTNSSLDLHDVDPLTESEVYSAYGRYEQAAMILESAVTKAPDRHELKIALMRMYAELKYFATFESLFLDIQDIAMQHPDDKHYLTTAIEIGHRLDPANPLYRSEPVIKYQEPNEVAELEGSATDADFFNVEEPDDGQLTDNEFQDVEDIKVQEMNVTQSATSDTLADLESSEDFHTSSLSDDLKKLQKSNVIEFETIKIPEASEPEEVEKMLSDPTEQTVVLNAPIIIEFETSPDTEISDKKTKNS